MTKTSTLPIPGKLGKLLTKSGIHAVITLTREGTAASGNDLVLAEAAVRAAEQIEESIDMLLESIAEFLPGMLGLTSRATPKAPLLKGNNVSRNHIARHPSE